VPAACSCQGCLHSSVPTCVASLLQVQHAKETSLPVSDPDGDALQGGPTAGRSSHLKQHAAAAPAVSCGSCGGSHQWMSNGCIWMACTGALILYLLDEQNGSAGRDQPACMAWLLFMPGSARIGLGHRQNEHILLEANLWVMAMLHKGSACAYFCADNCRE